LRHLERRSDGDDGHRKLTELHERLESVLLAAERERINELSRAGQLKDEARRRIERELDLRDAQLENLRAEE
jgi:CPA1 family monovalent cation:H+ antiporter